MDTLFISDLHLSPDRPDKLALFYEFLNGPARAARALYILGDLFEEFWVGNDDRTPPNAEILAALRAFTAGGVPLYMVRGNRELLLDHGFETLTGAILLPDGAVVEIDGARVLLMHGDRLCTRDRGYQLFRAFAECPVSQRLFGLLPLSLRTRIAHGLRPAMRDATLRKPAEIIDVEPGAVVRAMREAGVTELIHGHTHRPGVYEIELDGHAARRIVLGDWYEQDGVLVCRGAERRLMRAGEFVASA